MKLPGTEYRDAKAFVAFSAFFTRASLQSRNFLYISIIIKVKTARFHSI